MEATSRNLEIRVSTQTMRLYRPNRAIGETKTLEGCRTFECKICRPTERGIGWLERDSLVERNSERAPKREFAR